ncbi:hypothetical protein Tco_0123657 [Tanacetum coccineum]
MKSRKRKFIQNTFEDDSKKENDELRLHLTIAPDEEKEVDYEILDRNNGQKRYFSTLMKVLSIFDRDDLNDVYQLVMDRYQDETPEGFDRDWNIVSWKLHGSSGVHTLVTEAGLVIHMLIKKKYPLRKKVLLQMLELKLEYEEDSTMALELIRFVKKLVARGSQLTLLHSEELASPGSNSFCEELDILEQWVLILRVAIPHNLCNLVVTELDSTEKLMNEIGELRAISSHVFEASEVQILQNNLDNLRSTEEEKEDGETEVLDPRDVSGSVLLEIIDFAILGLLLEPLVLGTLGLLV